MNLDRYTRQISLKKFGIEGQRKLARAKILVVGAGGLGVPVLQYLNAMGVGTLGIVDNDRIDLANLQRQVIYDESDLGKPKTEVIFKKLTAQNSNTIFKIFDTYLDAQNATEIVSGFDLVIDASDNFPTRYLVNDICVLLKKPFVYGALHSFEGQVCVLNFQGGPTYRCLFPEMPSAEEIPDCNVNGVLGIIPGIIGSFQALEAVKLVTGVGELLSGKLLIYDGLTQRTRQVKFSLKQENQNISELQENYNSGKVHKSISSEDLFALLNSQTKIQVIDVRSPEEYDNFHIENTVNIPLPQLGERIAEIQTGSSIYFICQSGIRSQKALKFLEQYDLPDLINVEGGINQYKKHVTTP